MLNDDPEPVEPIVVVMFAVPDEVVPDVELKYETNDDEPAIWIPVLFGAVYPCVWPESVDVAVWVWLGISVVVNVCVVEPPVDATA